MRRQTLAFALTAVTLFFLDVPLTGRAQRVSFQTEDGVSIAATWHEPHDAAGGRAAGPAPAVILVHMLNRSRRDWDALGSKLAAAGIGALAIDLRGHGDSHFSRAADAVADYAVLRQDLKAARRFLASRTDVLSGRIGLAGASLGANLVALDAADGGVMSIALLSPSLDYRGLRIESALRKFADHPALLVASDEDAYSRRSVMDLQKTGSRREVLTLSGAGHGTNMLGRAPELPLALVDWFRRTLQ